MTSTFVIHTYRVHLDHKIHSYPPVSDSFFHYYFTPHLKHCFTYIKGATIDSFCQISKKFTDNRLKCARNLPRMEMCKIFLILLLMQLCFANVAIAATMNISESGTTTRTIDVTLNVDAAMSPGDNITIVGLTGSATDDGDLTLGGADSAKFTAATWTKITGTLVLTANTAVNANTNIRFTFPIAEPAAAQAAVSPTIATVFAADSLTAEAHTVSDVSLTATATATTKTIVESGTTTRTMAVRLNIDSAMSSGDNITIVGLTGSATDGDLDLIGTNASYFFKYSKAKWTSDTGRLTLNLISQIVADTVIEFKFDIDIPTANTFLGCVLFEPPKALHATISETGSRERILTIELKFNFPLSIGDKLKIDGLIGSATTSNGALKIYDGNANLFSNLGDWSQLEGKLVLTTNESLIAKTNISFKFAVASPNEKNAAAIAKVSVDDIDGNLDLYSTPLIAIEGGILKAAGFATEPIVERLSNSSSEVKVTFRLDADGKVTCGAYKPYAIKPTSDELLNGKSDSVFNETFVKGYIASAISNECIKSELCSVTLGGLLPYTPYDVYCVTDSHIFSNNGLYDVYTYGFKKLPSLYTNSVNDITFAMLLTDSYSGNIWYGDGTCEGNDNFNGDETGCKGEGTCADANGVIGNGATYNNNEDGCKAATDCGDEISNDPCVWDAIGGTCKSASGGIGNGDSYDNEAKCNAACHVCGYDKCIWTSKNNTWNSTASCSDPNYVDETACQKKLTSLKCAVSTDVDSLLNSILLNLTNAVGNAFVFESLDPSAFPSVKSYLNRSIYLNSTMYYMKCMTDEIISDNVYIYKLSSSPLIIGSTNLELTESILLNEEIHIISQVAIKSNDGYIFKITKSEAINDKRFFTIKENGHLTLHNLNLTMGDVSSNPGTLDCYGKHGGAICLSHASSILRLKNVSLYNNIVGASGFGGAIFAPRGYVVIEHVHAFNNYALDNIINPFHICIGYIFEHNMPDVYFDPNPRNETFFLYEGWKCNGVGTNVTELIAPD